MPRTNAITQPMDVEMGQAIRAIRVAQGLSQTAVGNMIGVQFQMIQKLETGKNRMSVGVLIILSKALGINPMDIIGPLIGEPSEAGELAKQVASLKQQPTAVRTAVREATK